MNVSEQRKIGSVLSYLQMLIGIIIGLVYTPVMLKFLGQNEYGLYSTVSSIISMLSVLNLGFGSSYVRYYAQYKIKEDKDGIYQLNGMFLIIFLVIGMVTFFCGIFFSKHLTLLFSDGLTSEEYKIAKVLMILLTVNLSISFPLSVFSTIIIANEKFVFEKTVYMIKTVLIPCVTVVFLYMGYRSIAMVTVTLILSILCDSCYVVYVIKVLKNKFVFTKLKKEQFSGIFVFTIFIAINIIVDQINWNIDKILLGRYCGTQMVAVYSVGYSLYVFYQSFSTSISGIFTPKIHLLISSVTGENEQRRVLTELFTKVGRIQFLVLGLVMSGFLFFGRFFILKIWAGEGYEDSYVIALLLMLPATIPLIQNLGIEIQRAQNRHQFRSIVYLAMAFINLGLSIVLCQKYGGIGSAIGTAISLVVANGFIINIYYHKKCNIDVIAFWKSITKMFGGLVVPCIVGFVFNHYVIKDSIPLYLMCVGIYVIVYACSVWMFSMNRYEKELVLSVVKRKNNYRRG